MLSRREGWGWYLLDQLAPTQWGMGLVSTRPASIHTVRDVAAIQMVYVHDFSDGSYIALHEEKPCLLEVVCKAFVLTSFTSCTQFFILHWAINLLIELE